MTVDHGTWYSRLTTGLDGWTTVRVDTSAWVGVTVLPPSVSVKAEVIRAQDVTKR